MERRRRRRIARRGIDRPELVAPLRYTADKLVDVTGKVESVVRTEGVITVRALPGTEVLNTTSLGDIKLGTGATTVGGPAPGPGAN
jgi:hypothetical protein